MINSNNQASLIQVFLFNDSWIPALADINYSQHPKEYLISNFISARLAPVFQVGKRKFVILQDTAEYVGGDTNTCSLLSTID